MKHKQTKEAIGVVKKFTKLCQEDSDFEEKFMIFFENLIMDYKTSNMPGEEVDRRLSDYLDKYTRKKRDNKITSILRKKE